MERQSLGPSGSNPVAEEQFRKGFELAKAGEIDEGILAVEAAIAVSPEEGRYHDLMGTLYAKKGLYEMAVSEWKRSIECDPDHAEVFRRIENAAKLKAQTPPRSDWLVWIAMSVVSFLFVLSLAWAVYQVRNHGAIKDRLAEKEAELARVEQDYVSKSDHQSILDMTEELSGKIEVLEAQVAARDQEITGLKDETRFVPKETLQKESELRNQAEGDLRLAREEIAKIKTQLQAVGNATGAQALTEQIELKDQDLAQLRNNYKTLNDDRNRLEEELAASKERVVNLQAQLDDLQAQFVASGTSALQIASVSGENFLGPMLEESLKALVELHGGNRDGALASLRGLEARSPNMPVLQEAIVALSPEETGERVEPTATMEPTQAPTKAPTSRPTATKRPTARPTATPIPKPTGPISPAKPRPVGGASRSVAESPKPAPRQQPSEARSRDDQAERLQKQKAAYTQQAYQAYQNRDFSRAKQLVDRAYRIDPRDPAVNQLRGAIERALSR